jgi:transposase
MERYEVWKSAIPIELEVPFKPLTTAVGNWKGDIFAYWDHPVTNAYTEAVAGLVKITNRVGRGYSFQAIRAKLLYSNLSTVHKPVFNRLLESTRPYMVLEEIKDYGIPFSTLIRILGEA